MSVEALKCPSCGAPLKSKDVTKCEYCGAILVFKNEKLTLKNVVACSKCGAIVGEGSFFCNNCEELLTTSSEDLNFLRSTLKKVKLLQAKWRNLIGQIDARFDDYHTIKTRILEDLGRDEYIYGFVGSEIVSNVWVFWVVTNKRVLRYSDGKVFNDVDIPHEDIAFVTEPIHATLSGVTFYRVDISPYQGDEHSFFHRDYEIAYEFYKMCAAAHEDYESARDLKRKDTILLLWKSRDKIG
jgi:hypothetical protein